MKFGVRECANIVFRAKQATKIGDKTFASGQPVLYIDSATTSSLEQATTTVYAQGGRGNTRLISWDGEKTLTFNFTDALLSPIGFSILAGAGLFKGGDGSGNDENNKDYVHFHMTSMASMTVTDGQNSNKVGTIDLSGIVGQYGADAKICIDDAPIYIMKTEPDGSLTGELVQGAIAYVSEGSPAADNHGKITVTGAADKIGASDNVMVDYYIDIPGAHVWEADITPETFAGNYYVEADTLFRDTNGVDLPANLTFPNVKIQSNFTMTFAGTGDPSTFDFAMDAFPGYTYFDKRKKVLCVLQIVDTTNITSVAEVAAELPVMYHDTIRQDTDSVNTNDSNSSVLPRPQE